MPHLLPDRRLLPAVVALLLYPVIDRYVWSVVVILPLLVWWSIRAAGPGLEQKARLFATVAAVVVIVLGPLVIAPLLHDWWNEIGKFSGYAFRLGLWGLTAAAIVLGLRLTLGDSPGKRALFVSGFGFGFILTMAVYLGDLPGWVLVDLPARVLGLDGFAGLGADVLVLSLLFAFVFVALAPVKLVNFVGKLDAQAVPPAAGVALVLPAIFVVAALIDHGSVTAGKDLDFAVGAVPAQAPASLSPAELAQRYRPLFLIDANESWQIESVDSYLADATVSKLAGGADPPVPEHPGVAGVPRSCARPADENTTPDRICFVISAGCEDVGRGCDRHHVGRWEAGKVPAGVVYARVLSRGSPPADGSPDIFKEPVAFAELQTLIQYWIFYRNDLWRADTGFGRLTQRHEADWETVMVGLSVQQPLFVAYSAHCGGEVVDWAKVSTFADGTAVRPVVWVARGSHANYPDPTPRTPDFTSCPRAPRTARFLLARLAFAANLRETLPDALVRQSPNAKLIDAHSRELSVPARWSRTDKILIKNLFHSAAVPPGRSPRAEPSGPETPTCKAMWRDPLPILACSKYWGDRSRCLAALKVRFEEPDTGCI